MSKPASAIYAILVGDATVSGIVGDRVYRNQAEQGDAFPYVLIEVENTDPFPSKGGSSAADHVFVNVYSYSEDQTVLDTLSEAVRTALDEKTAGTYGGVSVDNVRFQGETDFDEEETNRKIFAVDQSYRIRVIR